MVDFFKIHTNRNILSEVVVLGYNIFLIKPQATIKFVAKLCPNKYYALNYTYIKIDFIYVV